MSVRIKADLSSLPEELRDFVPMFTEFLPYIGTKNYSYSDFNDRVLSVSNGVEVSIDKFASDGDDIMDRKEQLLISFSFLERNMDKAFEYLGELLATPNFNEPSNIADLIRMGSVQKANSIGDKALDYALSYSQSHIRAWARSFENLRNDVFYC